jgi:Ni,Fe-hydrogenase III component G
VTREEALHKIKAALGERLIAIEEKSAKRAFVELSPDDVPTASHLMLDELKARFQIATGVDTSSAIEVMYHWALDSLGCVITVRTRLDRNDPCIDSLAPFCPAAEWIEREMWELLGIRFRNHPDMRHLLLSDDWPEGKYPLRRDYQA